MNKNSLKKSLTGLILVSNLLLAAPAYAQAAPPRLSAIPNMVDRIFGYIFPIAALAAVGMIVYGGYMWMMSTGDPAKIKSAQGTLTWAILGLVFLALVEIIVQEIIGFLL